jgi:hypothetical protein
MSLVLLALTATRVLATDAGDADALIARGLELRRAGDDQKALPLFQQALEKKITPRALAQVGLCELALGLWVEGEDHLQQALAGKSDAWIHKNERQLKVALDHIQDNLGSLDVWGEPAGARVAVDGHPMGTLPLEHPLRLPAGRHSLLIEATGFLSDSRFVDVPARAAVREHTALAAVPVLPQPPRLAAADPEPAPAAQSSGATVVAQRSGPEPAATEETRTPIYKRWWFWTAIGVVAVGAGGTAYLLMSRNDKCDSAGGPCVTW